MPPRGLGMGGTALMRSSSVRPAHGWQPPAALLFGGALSLPLLAWAVSPLWAGAWHALLLLTLYTVPGLAVLHWLLPAAQSTDWHPLTRPVLALAVSTALPPVLLHAVAVVGGQWGHVATGGYLLLALLAVLVPVARHRAGLPHALPRLDGAGGVLLLLALLTLLTRLWVVRDLPTGLLGDSYQHTTMAQLLVDNGGLFQSWQPYAPLTTMTYHFGFHANVAFVHWLTGIPVPQAVLLVGQILNTIMVLVPFALVGALRGSAWVAVFAVLLTGFATELPGFFVNWGRYTQLTGQVVLVAVLVAWVLLADRTTRPHGRWQWRTDGRVLALAVLLALALSLTHYRVAMLGGLYVAVLLGTYAWHATTWRTVGRLVLVATSVGGATLLLVLPWLGTVVQGYLLRNTAAFVSGAVGEQRLNQAAVLPPVFPLFSPAWLLPLAVVGVGWLIWQRQWRMLLPVGWLAAMVLAVAPWLLGLPGVGVMDYLTGFGELSLLLAPLAGVAVAAAVVWVGQRVPARVAAALPLAVVALVLVVGVPRQLAIIAPSESNPAYAATQLVTPADVQAMQWIRRSTPADAHFLVQSFPAYGGTLLAGSDAGWWLPLLARRSSTLPPLTYGSELGPSPTFSRDVNTLAVDLRGRPLTDDTAVSLDLTTPAARARLARAGVTHVYIGAHASPPRTSVDHFDLDALRRSPVFTPVYDRDGVLIFELQQDEQD